MHREHDVGFGLDHLQVHEHQVAALGVGADDDGLGVVRTGDVADLAGEHQFALVARHVDVAAELHLDHAVAGEREAGGDLLGDEAAERG